MSSLLAAIDFSDATPCVLAHAARLAQSRGDTLHVLHVISEERLDDLASAVSFPRNELAEQLIAGAREQLDAAIAGVRGLDLETHVEIGTPYDVIAALAGRLSTDLLVIGARGEGGYGPGVGSVALKCMRRTPSDVLAVRPDEQHPFRTITACVDLSEVSPIVVETAARCAVADGGRLILVHVHSNPFDHPRFSLPVNTTEQYEAYVATLRQRLERLREAITAPADVDCHLECAPNYGQAIVEHAKKSDADLIVLGTVGRTNLRYVLLGSTAEKILRTTPCSVLAVRPRRRAGEPPLASTRARS